MTRSTYDPAEGSRYGALSSTLRDATKVEPAHVHTIEAAGEGRKTASCRCGGWTATAATSSQIAEAFRQHLAAQGVLR